MKITFLGTGQGEWEILHDIKSFDCHFAAGSRGGDSFELEFIGTKIRWMGHKGIRSGKARIYLDGRPVTDLELYDPGKRRGLALFEATGLTRDFHTLKVENLGEKCPDSIHTLVRSEGVAISGTHDGQWELIINNEWNYRDIGWGNYRRSAIFPGEGYTNQVQIRLTDRDAVEESVDLYK